MPGPLSSTVTRKTSLPSLRTETRMSGKTSASSQASRELSIASLMVVMIPRVGESKPSMCLFFSKNSATLMLRCFLASSSASTMSCYLGDGVCKAHLLLCGLFEVFEGDGACGGFLFADECGVGCAGFEG